MIGLRMDSLACDDVWPLMISYSTLLTVTQVELDQIPQAA